MTKSTLSLLDARAKGLCDDCRAAARVTGGRCHACDDRYDRALTAASGGHL